MKKFLFDLFPVIVFFALFKYGEANVATSQMLVLKYLGFLISDGKVPEMVAPVLLATAVSILATILQIGYLLVTRQKVDGMLWLSFAIIAVFGGMTIYFHSETFIKWKPTVLYWCFGGGMLISQFLFKRNMIRTMLEAQMSLPDAVWSKVGISWAMFFVVMGVLNLYVAFNFPTATWVNFKLFGGSGLMFVFVIAQSMYLGKYLEQDQNQEKNDGKPDAR